MHYVQSEVGGDFLYVVGSDALRLRAVPVNECVFADRIDQPGYPTRLPVHLNDCVRRDQLSRARASGHMQTALDVTSRLVEIKRAKVRAHGNTLLQLSQINRVKLLIQLRLAN